MAVQVIVEVEQRRLIAVIPVEFRLGQVRRVERGRPFIGDMPRQLEIQALFLAPPDLQRVRNGLPISRVSISQLLSC